MQGTSEKDRYAVSTIVFRAGRGIFNQILDKCFKSDENEFKAQFGVSPMSMAKLWGLLQTKFTPSLKPFNLFWALLILHLYSADIVSGQIAQADVKMFRK